MIYTIEYLRENLPWHRGYNLESTLIGRVKNYVEESEITNIYFKNLFKDNEKLELYVFAKAWVFIFSYTGEGNDFTKVSIRKLEDINNIEVISGDEYENQRKLKIAFKDGHTIELNSANDTNDHHSNKYSKVIKDIVTEILKSS